MNIQLVNIQISKVGLSDSENDSKTLTIHNYEYYHNSYTVSISVHKIMS